MINDLINDESLSFCLSCGRLLYLTEPEAANSRRAVEVVGASPTARSGPSIRGPMTLTRSWATL